jgi:exo-1,4-beta-D-glucosaminidase
MKKNRLLTLAILCGGCGGGTGISLAAGDRLVVATGWAIRSSAALKDDGKAIATVGYAATGWTPARVPGTVIATRLLNRELPDVDVGMNLRDIVGGDDYAIGGNFSLADMSPKNPYRVSWWYRTEIDLPRADERGTTWLSFDGINYRANIWLNGQRIAGDGDVVGAYRRYAFDVTATARRGQRNALAVQVFAPTKDDLAPGFADWNPMPADKDMGIWQDVYVTTTGPVRLQNALVTAKIAPSRKSARLTVDVDLVNATGAPVSGTLNGTIDGSIAFMQTVALAPHETKTVRFDPAMHSELVLLLPLLWWPYQLGPQNLHDLQLDFAVAGKLSDRLRNRFGIREVTMDLVNGQWASYKVNGKPIFIRGAGYSSDMLFRFSDDRDEQEMQLVKDLGLNTIRLSGKLADDHLLDVTDREGILVIAGWECCSAWEYWDNQSSGAGAWSGATRAVAKASLESQLVRLRGRASLLTWLYGSRSHPPPPIELMYIDVVKAMKWPLPVQNQASERNPSVLSGPSGFKMPGPYDYVPPIYWYVDNNYGGAFGFNSEAGLGAAVPNVESLKKLLPDSDLWPIDQVWNYHAGGGRFAGLDTHTQALTARYGQAVSVADYALKAQLLSYDGERALFEAYRRNKGKTTGVIAWMLNNGWPSLFWHLYDYYLAAGGGYYGAKKANELVHIQYSYDDQTIVVVNDSPDTVKGLKASVEVYDLRLNKVFAQDQAGLDVPTDKSVVALTIPALSNLDPVYFVRLLLHDDQDQIISQNFYWLSTKADMLDWAHSDWWGTPVLAHADLTALASLPMVAPVLSASSDSCAQPGTLHVTVKNGDNNLAFMVRLRVEKGAGGAEALPSMWSDNYLNVLPGETRDVTVQYSASALGGAPPVVAMSGWNVAETLAAPCSH